MFRLDAKKAEIVSDSKPSLSYSMIIPKHLNTNFLHWNLKIGSLNRMAESIRPVEKRATPAGISMTPDICLNTLLKGPGFWMSLVSSPGPNKCSKL